MTREEAITELNVIYERLSHPENCENGVYSFRDGDYLEALNMAIETLEQNPNTGHWMKTPKAIMGEGYMWYCNKCGYEVYQDSSRPYPSQKYCPNCGAKMIEPQERADT